MSEGMDRYAKLLQNFLISYANFTNRRKDNCASNGFVNKLSKFALQKYVNFEKYYAKKDKMHEGGQLIWSKRKNYNVCVIKRWLIT